MILEAVFLGILILGICIVAYRGAVHEFMILQKDYGAQDIDWSELLGEQLPLVIRGLPKMWLGNWNERATAKKTWQVQVQKDGRRFRTSWSNWIATPAPRPLPENIGEIANVARLKYAFESWAADGFRRWSWLPVGTPQPYVFSKSETQGVQKVVSEFQAITATDGAPLELWIAHEGAIPSNVACDLLGKDPWIQTTDDIPWIGEVKYIEVKLRPGNAIVIPRHWYYALRTAPMAAGDDDSENVNAWFWVGAFQTPISLLASSVLRRHPPQISSGLNQ
jgi:hypothetical protein